MTRRQNTFSAIMLVIPLIAAILWAVSGFERLTKSGKHVPVPPQNDVFGDSDPVLQLQPGPIFGYYIGLDLVLISFVSAVAIVFAAWLVERRRRPTPLLHGNIP